MPETPKPWFYCYSSILGLLSFIGGITLILTGHTDIGIPLVAAATGIGLAKADSKVIAPLLLVGVLMLSSGCQTGMIHVEAIEPALVEVLDRHDAYVEADMSLSDLAKEIYLRTTEILRKLLEEARK